MTYIIQSSLLEFMESRHHAGDSVAVLVIDEQGQPEGMENIRLNNQALVLRTAKYIGVPVWFVEIGGLHGPDRSIEKLQSIAGINNRNNAINDGRIFQKTGTDAMADNTPLSDYLNTISYLVVMGREASCCVSHTILGEKSEGGAVSKCTVLTSRAVVREVGYGLHPTVINHPKCLVFENLGSEMWSLGPLPFPSPALPPPPTRKFPPLPPIPTSNI